MATATPEGSPSVGQKTDVRLALAWVLLPLFFLVTGGSLGWWQAWVYCVLLLVPMTYFITRTAQKAPEFLDRRFGWSHTPTAAVVAAEVLVLASYLGVLRVFTVNRWAGRSGSRIPEGHLADGSRSNQLSFYTGGMSGVAEVLSADSRARLRGMTAEERLAEALALGRRAITAYAAAHGTDENEARRRLERAAQAGRLPSRVMRQLAE